MISFRRQFSETEFEENKSTSIRWKIAVTRNLEVNVLLPTVLYIKRIYQELLPRYFILLTVGEITAASE